MAYRTKTYIAGDWDGDKDAIDQLYKWKESKYLSLDFIDAHDLHQARDTSLNCSIKSHLASDLMSRNVLCSLWERKLRISGVAAVNCARAITAGPGLALVATMSIIAAMLSTSARRRKVTSWLLLSFTTRRTLIGIGARIVSNGLGSTWQCNIAKTESIIGIIRP